jgi:hypothetical protein
MKKEMTKRKWKMSTTTTTATTPPRNKNSERGEEKRKRKKSTLSNTGRAFSEEEKLTSLDSLREWLDTELSLGSAPRSSDILEWAQRNELKLSRAEIRKAVRLHPSYEASSHQQRERLSSRKYRLITTNTLGQLHCDIGFFPASRRYKTPPTYLNGFLIAVDVLSRFVYLELLGGSRDAKTLIRVFKRILKKHPKKHPIVSISFDKENAMRSAEMDRFLAEHHLAKELFGFSSSKAKMAENAIKRVRTQVERLAIAKPERRWWSMLPVIAKTLNSREIKIEGKRMGFAPRDVDSHNLEEFMKRLHKKVPAYYASQFRIPTQFVKYKFKVGDIVRPKSLLASSQVIGVKRSQVNLEPQHFRIDSLHVFVTKDLHARPAYRCINVEYGDVEIFAEQDIALSSGVTPNTEDDSYQTDTVVTTPRHGRKRSSSRKLRSGKVF